MAITVAAAPFALPRSGCLRFPPFPPFPPLPWRSSNQHRWLPSTAQPRKSDGSTVGNPADGKGMWSTSESSFEASRRKRRKGKQAGCALAPQTRNCLPHSGGVEAAVTSSPTPVKFTHEDFEGFVLSMQGIICDAAADADGSGKKFCEDRWQRGDDPIAGYGVTRVMEDGDLLEKAAVNISVVRSQLSESRSKAMSARGRRGVSSGAQYFAGALSLVFHPRSPYVPTFRSDIRYFEVEGVGGWFGGGADLTPSYLFEDDARFFHEIYKRICDKHDPTEQLYATSKEACDAYFYIPARSEHRGIGGIFFDDMESLGTASADGVMDRDRVFVFVKDIAEGFMPSYLPLAQRRRRLPYGERERQWQLLRRGRYLEFNLLYDRGVKFGLDGGRIESIMVSAPPLSAWKYSFYPEEDSAEAKLVQILKNPVGWV